MKYEVPKQFQKRPFSCPECFRIRTIIKEWIKMKLENFNNIKLFIDEIEKKNVRGNMESPVFSDRLREEIVEFFFQFVCYFLLVYFVFIKGMQTTIQLLGQAPYSTLQLNKSSFVGCAVNWS